MTPFVTNSDIYIFKMSLQVKLPYKTSNKRRVSSKHRPIINVGVYDVRVLINAGLQ